MGTTKIRQIEIDGKEIGIAGILELFKRYYDDGKGPEEVGPDELLEELRKMNHIPEDKEEEYEEVFIFFCREDAFPIVDWMGDESAFSFTEPSQKASKVIG